VYPFEVEEWIVMKGIVFEVAGNRASSEVGQRGAGEAFLLRVFAVTQRPDRRLVGTLCPRTSGHGDR